MRVQNLLSIVACAILLISAAASAQSTTPPQTPAEPPSPLVFVDDLAKSVFSILNLETDESKKSAYCTLVSAVIDLDQVAEATTGQWFKASLPEDIAQFKEALLALLVADFTRAFSDFKGGQLEIRGNAIRMGANDVGINTQLNNADPEKRSTRILFKIRKYTDNTLKIIDAKVESINLIQLRTADFSSVLTNAYDSGEPYPLAVLTRKLLGKNSACPKPVPAK